MHIYFYFYATMVNIPMGFLHTTKLSTWCFRIYDAANNIYIYIIMQCSCRKVNMLKENDYAEKINMDNY
jgi:hypothetical protein